MSKRTDNDVHGTTVTPFKAFEHRIRKVIHEQSKHDIMLSFNQKQLETLYNKVLSVIETSIFAEMEHVMNSILNSLQVVIAIEGESKSLNSFMSNEDHFKRFVTYVVTNYQSLQEHRIDILMIHNTAYQSIEDELFGEVFISENGFEMAFDIHLEMIQAFHNCYHELLFEGMLLDADNKIEVNVIEPVIQRYEEEIQVGGMVE